MCRGGGGRGVLRCQAQLKLTLMMCLSDRYTSTGALSDRSTSTGVLSDHSTFTSTDGRDGYLPLFFWRTCCRLGSSRQTVDGVSGGRIDQVQIEICCIS
jgi:hypothetical protein